MIYLLRTLSFFLPFTPINTFSFFHHLLSLFLLPFLLFLPFFYPSFRHPLPSSFYSFFPLLLLTISPSSALLPSPLHYSIPPIPPISSTCFLFSLNFIFNTFPCGWPTTILLPRSKRVASFQMHSNGVNSKQRDVAALLPHFPSLPLLPPSLTLLPSPSFFYLIGNDRRWGSMSFCPSFRSIHWPSTS